jgi:hypothetical protein
VEIIVRTNVIATASLTDRRAVHVMISWMKIILPLKLHCNWTSTLRQLTPDSIVQFQLPLMYSVDGWVDFGELLQFEHTDFQSHCSSPIQTQQYHCC